MSRLAKKLIECPKGVEVKCEGRKIDVKGPKGALNLEIPTGIEIKVEDGAIEVLATEALKHYPFLGLHRSLVKNAIIGVSQGYEKKLELVGVGFKAAVKGNVLDLSLGFSHPSLVDIPEGLTISVEKNTLITVAGIDKHMVGQFAASVRAIRPPEPYKGKGVKYQNEVIRRKQGKASK